MAAPGHVLVVGGGAAGTATAILLARAGVTVDLVEAGTEIGRSGSGITLQGNALRVFRDLGVLDDVLAAGYAFDVLGLRTPDGTVIAEFPDARTGGDDLPATVGMPRGEMARLLAEEYRRFVADPDADTKAFAARHAAGKGALAHLDLLMKPGGRGEDEPGADAAADHLDAARAAVASLEGEGEADPDDDDDAGRG